LQKRLFEIQHGIVSIELNGLGQSYVLHLGSNSCHANVESTLEPLSPRVSAKKGIAFWEAIENLLLETKPIRLVHDSSLEWLFTNI